jgi:Tfp pilus assembly protein PilO
MTGFWIVVVVLLMVIAYCLGYVIAIAHALDIIDKWKAEQS